MKKIIAILLVLSVMFVAFAYDAETTDASMEITASVAGRLFHGFTQAGLTATPTSSSIKDIAATLESSAAIDLIGDGAGTTDYTVGYYNLFSTGNAAKTIGFIVNPLKTAEIDGYTYYVPYKLTVDALVDETNMHGITNAADTLVSTEIDLGATPERTVGTAASSTVIQKTEDVLKATATPGRKWASVLVKVTIDEAANDGFGLPAGDDIYEATITATLTSS